MLRCLTRFHRHFATSRFAAKFGKEKAALVEELVELKSADILERCSEYGLTPGSKKGQNLQRIITYINKIEKEIEL